MASLAQRLAAREKARRRGRDRRGARDPQTRCSRWLSERLARTPRLGGADSESRRWSPPRHRADAGAARSARDLDAPHRRATSFRQAFAIYTARHRAQLAAKLEAEGAIVRKVDGSDRRVDAFVSRVVETVLRCARCSGVREPRSACEVNLLATMNGELGRAGAGGPRASQTLAAEWPAIKARVVDNRSCGRRRGAPARRAARGRRSRRDRIRRRQRSSLEIVPATLEQLGASSELGLDSNSVVLVTGGARGITAKTRSRSPSVTAAGSSWSAARRCGDEDSGLAAPPTRARCARYSRSRVGFPAEPRWRRRA